MQKTIALFLLVAMPLAGCLQDPGSRAVAGAIAGAAIADATDENLVAGAALGGLAGAATCSIPGTLGC